MLGQDGAWPRYVAIGVGRIPLDEAKSLGERSSSIAGFGSDEFLFLDGVVGGDAEAVVSFKTGFVTHYSEVYVIIRWFVK